MNNKSSTFDAKLILESSGFIKKLDFLELMLLDFSVEIFEKKGNITWDNFINWLITQCKTEKVKELYKSKNPDISDLELDNLDNDIWKIYDTNLSRNNSKFNRIYTYINKVEKITIDLDTKYQRPFNVRFINTKKNKNGRYILEECVKEIGIIGKDIIPESSIAYGNAHGCFSCISYLWKIYPDGSVKIFRKYVIYTDTEPLNAFDKLFTGRGDQRPSCFYNLQLNNFSFLPHAKIQKVEIKNVINGPDLVKYAFKLDQPLTRDDSPLTIKLEESCEKLFFLYSDFFDDIARINKSRDRSNKPPFYLNYTDPYEMTNIKIVNKTDLVELSIECMDGYFMLNPEFNVKKNRQLLPDEREKIEKRYAPLDFEEDKEGKVTKASIKILNPEINYSYYIKWFLPRFSEVKSRNELIEKPIFKERKSQYSDEDILLWL